MLKLLNEPGTILTGAGTLAVPSALSALSKPNRSASRVTFQNAQSAGNTKGLQKATVAVASPNTTEVDVLCICTAVARIRALRGPVSTAFPVSTICPFVV